MRILAGAGDTPAVGTGDCLKRAGLMRLVLNVIGVEFGLEGTADAPAAAGAHDQVAGVELRPFVPAFGVGGDFVLQDQVGHELNCLGHLGVKQV